MASTITMASSTTRPIATAIPPSDMRLSVWCASRIPTKVMASVIGTVVAARSPARRSRRKSAMTPAHRTTPTRMASRTLAIDSRTRRRLVVDRLDRRRPRGATGRRAATAASARSTTSGVLAPGRRATLTHHGLSAGTPDADDAVLVALDHLGDGAERDAATPSGTWRRQLADVGEGLGLGVADHGHDLPVAVDAPHRAKPHRLPQAIGDGARGQVQRGGHLWPQDDLELAHVAPEHLDAPDARQRWPRQAGRRTRRAPAAHAGPLRPRR